MSPLFAAAPVTRTPAPTTRLPVGQLTRTTFGLDESWALTAVTSSRPLRPEKTDAGNFFVVPRASRRPASGRREAWMPSTRSEFSAKRAFGVIASRAAWPTGVSDARAISRAVAERAVGSRPFISCSFHLALVGASLVRWSVDERPLGARGHPRPADALRRLHAARVGGGRAHGRRGDVRRGSARPAAGAQRQRVLRDPRRPGRDPHRRRGPLDAQVG